MEKRNLYKMDDILIVMSFLMLIPAAFIAWPWLSTIREEQEVKAFFLSARSILGYRFETCIYYLVGSVSAQIVGRMIRRREKQSLKILDYLNYARDTTTSQIAQNLNMSESKVSALSARLVRIKALHINRESNRLWIGLEEASMGTTGFSSAPSTPSSSFTQQEVKEESQSLRSPAEMAAAGVKPTEEIKKMAENLNLREMLANPDLSKQQRMDLFRQAMQEKQSAINSGSTSSGSGNAPLFTPSPSTGGSTKPEQKVPILAIIFMFTPLWPIGIVLFFRFIIQKKKAEQG